jgi:hypothetical protein
VRDRRPFVRRSHRSRPDLAEKDTPIRPTGIGCTRPNNAPDEIVTNHRSGRGGDILGTKKFNAQQIGGNVECINHLRGRAS